MDISALLLSCSVHVDDALLMSIAYVSQRDTSSLVLDVNPQTLGMEASPEPRSSSDDPHAAVARLLAIGGEPVFGVLPVRSKWANEFGKTLDALFEPCTAIAIASAKLSEWDYSCRRRGLPRSPARRACALSAYGTALGLPALPRAVLADLTLPSPDAELAELLALVPAAAAGNPTHSGLFFAVEPLAPATRLDLDSPALAAEPSP